MPSTLAFKPVDIVRMDGRVVETIPDEWTSTYKNGIVAQVREGWARRLGAENPLAIQLCSDTGVLITNDAGRKLRTGRELAAAFGSQWTRVQRDSAWVQQQLEEVQRCRQRQSRRSRGFEAETLGQRRRSRSQPEIGANRIRIGANRRRKPARDWRKSAWTKTEPNLLDAVKTSENLVRRLRERHLLLESAWPDRKHESCLRLCLQRQRQRQWQTLAHVGQRLAKRLLGGVLAS